MNLILNRKKVVFTRTKSEARWVSNQLKRYHQCPAESIHGDRSQSQRESALRHFKEGDIRVLVATDVAARGLDIDGIKHVINFSLPDEFDSYVHRIGRTGRAGNDGEATTFYIPGTDKKSTDGKLGADILKAMKESKSEVPNWFTRLEEMGNRAFHSSNQGGKKFGGTDVRGGGKRTQRPQAHRGKGGSSNDVSPPEPPKQHQRSNSRSRGNGRGRGMGRSRGRETRRSRGRGTRRSRESGTGRRSRSGGIRYL